MGDNKSNKSGKIDHLKRIHLADLKNATKNELPPSLENLQSVIVPSKNVVSYMANIVKDATLSWAFDWTSPIAHPLNVFFYVSIYVPLYFAAIPLEVVLRFVEWAGWAQSEGTTIENWRKLSGNIDSNLKKGFESLEELIQPEEERRLRKFDIDRAEALIYLAALMYNRDENSILEAKKELNRMNGSQMGPNDINMDRIVQLLTNADKPISDEIADFKINFKSITEMSQYGGPYAGIYWSVEHNFIVAAFKGTSPTSVTEWLLDFSVQRMDGRPYLFGNVHKGFYGSLFPKNEFASAESDRGSGSFFLIEAIKKQAKVIIEKNGKRKVNVWVTGHSLGSAYATLFYSRLLKAKESLGDQCLLRDAYPFASPLVGDNNFSAEFFSLYNSDSNVERTLWRIVNDNDIVTRVPPHNLQFFRPYADNIYVTNYVHVGDEVLFYQDASKAPVSHRKIYGETPYERYIHDNTGGALLDDIFFKKHHKDKKKQHAYNKKLDGYLYGIVERFVPSIFRNHIHYRYYVAFEKARSYFE